MVNIKYILERNFNLLGRANLLFVFFKKKNAIKIGANGYNNRKTAYLSIARVFMHERLR